MSRWGKVSSNTLFAHSQTFESERKFVVIRMTLPPARRTTSFIWA